MKIIAIELSNIRGFRQLPRTEFSESINIFIGANNSGKSTILNSIFKLQRETSIYQSDVTIGEQNGQIILYISGNHPNYIDKSHINASITMNTSNDQKALTTATGQHLQNLRSIIDTEPHNLIYPYLSKRKAVNFYDQINEQNTNSVLGNFMNLYSKIDRLITPQFQPGNNQYINACKNILGFEISTLASSGGKKAVYFVHNQEHIPLTAMGEGVTNIIGLITDLCVAENKIFLIEEPENDIHPSALKNLLQFIIEKSSTNQFFISTHSNIVMKYLGAIPDTKIFQTSIELTDEKRPSLFVSKLTEVSTDPEERKSVLENLGYEFNDFGIWNGWLFLEESSAEVLIREWFIKWYTPKLKDKLRTFSANSLSQITPKFDDFNRLFVFLHLEPVYKNKVWVILDDGENEKIVINKLQETYRVNGWKVENFSQFSEHDFEKYYPPFFREKVNEAIEEKDKQRKRALKKELLNEVKNWIAENEKEAKELFKVSAEPVINKLKEIAKQI